MPSEYQIATAASVAHTDSLCRKVSSRRRVARKAKGLPRVSHSVSLKLLQSFSLSLFAAASASDAEQLRAVTDAAEPAPAASGGLKDVDMLLVLLDTSSKEEAKPPEIETVES